jgi:hypothetical protein
MAKSDINIIKAVPLMRLTLLRPSAHRPHLDTNYPLLLPKHAKTNNGRIKNREERRASHKKPQSIIILFAPFEADEKEK